ncbi:MAG: cAMP-activated global transcriptional regulator CRP [Gammaproteobacteria bacterium]|jgi:CRP/FNR family cyclic AMP-dependent transcriptional regulator|nr:MAG: cAMP-activated global transcriptional regulator CRP [Gammaproteobacteria bacterium]
MTELSFGGHELSVARFLEHCHRRNYPTKQTIIKEGDPSQDLYYIISGSVSVLIEDSKGHEIVLTYLNAGDFFGEIGLFNEDHKRTAIVRAKSRCEIAQISYERIKRLGDLLPDLLFAIASQMAVRLMKTSRKVSDLAFTDVKGRVARTLIDLCREPDAMTHPDGMLIKVTRQELGRIVGCSREMVGRVLKDLEEDRLISVSGKSIVVFGTR